MKKYLLAVLALGATMMMACNPNDSRGGAPEPTPDYTMTTDVLVGYIDYYGDYYEIDLNDFVLELDVVEFDTNDDPVSAKILYVEYLGALDNTSGVGTFSPSGPDWMSSEGLKANTYFSGVEVEDEVYGSAYMEMDWATKSITVAECIVDGDLTISVSGGNYTVKGMLKTSKDKLLKVDYTGELEFGDYTSEASPASLSVVKNVKIGRTPRHFSSLFKK